MAEFRSIAKKYPKTVYTVYLVLFIVVAGEVGCRIFMGFNPGYYTGFRNETESVRRYAYGIMKYNSDGFPDEEFQSVKTKPRIGYVGDSVCQGVGCGYGYRVSEVLEAEYPEFEHMNVAAGMSTAIHSGDAGKYLEVARDYDLDYIIYLLNLNDIAPDIKQVESNGSKKSGSSEVKVFRIRRLFDWLRGRSYLYTALRTAVKNAVMRSGYGDGNSRMYELFPEKYAEEFHQTARRVNTLGKALEKAGVDFYVVILPYEMQISQEAAETYAALGIEWEGASFLDRGPQRRLLKHLEIENVLDAYYAFVGEESGRDRSDYGVGECFVYNEGDRLDWNHPNRKGHRLIAEFMGRKMELFSRDSMETSDTAIRGGSGE